MSYKLHTMDDEAAVELLSLITDHVKNAIICFDCNTREIILVNRFAEVLFGWMADELLGHQITEIITHKNLIHLENEKVMAQHKDGEVFEISISTSVVEVKDDKVCVSVIVDMRDPVGLQEYRRKTREKLKQELEELRYTSSLHTRTTA